MPDYSSRTAVTIALACLLGFAALAPLTASAATTAGKVENSNLDSQLFYQLLIGEIELRNGEAGTAYEVLLDAARRTKDEQLFRRATDIALQARAGEQALSAARAWRTALPDSQDAHRYVVQLLVNLNRTAETLEPMRSLLRITPAAQRTALINALPRLFSRSTDRAMAATLIEQALQPYADAPETRVAARVSIGRAWLAAQDNDKALDHARRAYRQDPLAESPALLAVEMLPGTAAAEEIVTGHLTAKPDSNGVRLVYVRTLTTSQRYADAITQLEVATHNEPKLAPPWLTLGALHLEMRHPVEATAALKTFVNLVESDGEAKPGNSAMAATDDEETAGSSDRGLTQAWLLLSQAAEQQRDYAAAESWLGRIDNPQRALDVQTRRAGLLARQGKVAQARELIRLVPEKGPADQRAKFLAEAQVLREVKQWDAANLLLAEANQRFQNDADLLYEQSMMAEKLNRMDDMERLLRRVIEIKPDHHHAYNALGYSLAERNMRLAEAKSLIQKALALSPGEPFITDSLGWVEYRLGNRDEALRLLRGAYKSRPDPEIAAHLGEVLWVNGEREEARRVLREGQKRDANNDVLRETLARLQVDL
ncbi:MAG: tetratricopeptide repeat protein [Rhizobacter sp.]|nr:tetratricopeptide repeat protein [Rhizobacter sp.]